jgi:hypothetical protein
MLPALVLAFKGDKIGQWDTHAGRWVEPTPGRAFQLRCARFVAVRAMLADVAIVGVWPT